MAFLPKADLLSLEELDRLCSVFVAKGVTQAATDRRRAAGAARHHDAGFVAVAAPRERRAQGTDADHQWLAAAKNTPPNSRPAASKRINVSLDTLDADKFRAITRWGDLGKVLGGIDAAQAAGLHVKINAVALKGVNEDEIAGLIEWAHGRGMDLTVIEVMPLGEIGEDRLEQYLPLSMVRARLAERFTLDDIDYRTGGPARYVRVRETGGRLGFITPMTHNFCESCNRVRLTCTGTLYMCLGQEDAADLRAPLRASESNDLVNCRDRRGHLPQAARP